MRAVAPAGEDMLPRARKTRALLAYLCLTQDQRIRRGRLTGMFWELSGDARAAMSLRHALSELNDTVNRRVPGLIEIDRETVLLNGRACWVDAYQDLDQSERLLEDFDGVSPAFDHWLAAERIRFEDRVRNLLESELQRLTEADAAPELRAAAARRLVNFEPTHEGAVRSLMTAFMQMGDRGQAIREYERCRRALRASVDLPPSKETAALYEAIRLVSATGPAPRRPPVLDERGHEGGLGEFDAQARQPSIAVLPFRSLTGAGHHDYAAEGLVEDLLEGLSRVPNFFVISRLSTLGFRGQERPPREIGDVLGVGHVLSGSMGVLENQLGLSVELTDTRRGEALWFSKLNERSFDLAEVEDRLAEAVVRRLAPRRVFDEWKRTHFRRPNEPEAQELFLRAQENMHNSSRPVFETCQALLDAAIARDPRYATALAWRARWHLLRVAQGWSPDPRQDARHADSFARRAIECDATEPMASAVRGQIAAYLHKDFDLAFHRFATALRTNPNAAPVWLWSAAARAWAGDGPRAVAEAKKALALSPYDPLMHAYSATAAMAYLADARYERAVECALRSARESRSYAAAYTILAIALVLAGRETEARAAMRQLLELRPDFTVQQFRRRSPSCAGPNGKLYCEALAIAGAPISL